MTKNEIFTALTNCCKGHIFIAKSTKELNMCDMNLQYHIRVINKHTVFKPQLCMEVTDVLWNHLCTIEDQDVRDLVVMIREIYYNKANKLQLLCVSLKRTVADKYRKISQDRNTGSMHDVTEVCGQMIINNINACTCDCIEIDYMKGLVDTVYTNLLLSSDPYYSMLALDTINSNKALYTYTDVRLKEILVYAMDSSFRALNRESGYGNSRITFEELCANDGLFTNAIELTTPSYRVIKNEPSNCDHNETGIRENVGSVKRSIKNKKSDIKSSWSSYINKIKDRRKEYKAKITDENIRLREERLDEAVIECAREIEVIDQDINNVTQHFEKVGSTDKLFDIKQRLKRIEKESVDNKDRVEDIKALYKQVDVILSVLKKVDTKHNKNSVHIRIEPSMTDSIKRARDNNIARSEAVKEGFKLDDELFETKVIDLLGDSNTVEVVRELNESIRKNELIMKNNDNAIREANEERRVSKVNKYIESKKDLALDKKLLDIFREVDICDHGVSVITTHGEKETMIDKLYKLKKKLLVLKSKSEDNAKRLDNISNTDTFIDNVIAKLHKVNISASDTSKVKVNMEPIKEGVKYESLNGLFEDTAKGIAKLLPSRQVSPKAVNKKSVKDRVEFETFFKKGNQLFTLTKDTSPFEYFKSQTLQENINGFEHMTRNLLGGELVNVKLLKIDMSKKIAVINIPSLVDITESNNFTQVHDNKVIKKINNFMK